nr:VUT family protein [Endozoicomonas sp.]
MKIIKVFDRAQKVRYQSDSGSVYVLSMSIFIGRGLANRLPVEEKQKLLRAIGENHCVCSDKSFAGNYTFYMQDQFWAYFFLTLLFCSFVLISGIVFPFHYHLPPVDMAGGVIYFALAFGFLDAISELYGLRRSFMSAAVCVGLLLLLGGSLYLHWLMPSVMTPHLEYQLGTQADPESMMLIYRQFAPNLVNLGLGLLLAGLVNILLFQLIRDLLRRLPFVVRSFVSSFTAISLFMIFGATFRFGNWMMDAELRHWVWDALFTSWVVIFFTVFMSWGIITAVQKSRKCYRATSSNAMVRFFKQFFV